MEEIIKIPLSLIERDPEQPRTEFDEEYIKGLSSSIKAEGVRNAINVRVHPEKIGYYMLVNGECRFRATTLANLQEIPAIIREYESEADMKMEQALDNIARKKMSAMDEIKSYKTIMDLGKSIEQVSESTGVTLATIEADLKILKLKEKYQKMVNNGTMAKAVARKFSEIDKKKQDQIFNKHINKKSGAKAQIKAIEAYIAQSKQVSLFALESESISTNDRKDMQKFLVLLQQTSTTIKESPYSNGKAISLVNNHSKKIKEMEAIAETLMNFAKHFNRQIMTVKASRNM